MSACSEWGNNLLEGLIMGRNRLRTYALLASVALLSTLVVVPAFGDSHLEGIDAVEFTTVDGVPRFEYEGLDPQLLTTPQNTCAIVNPVDGGSVENILNLTSTGGAPGLNDLSIGVRANGRNANGTPCSQIDSSEALTIKPGLALAGSSFSKVRLDLEMTGDAIVRLTLSDGAANSKTFILQTGTSASTAQKTEADFDTVAPFFVSTNPSTDADLTDACASSTSSGPNSNVNDNCIWTVEPGYDFNSITLTVGNGGTASLEGGSDTGQANTSLFYLAPDRLNCDEDVTFEGLGEPTYTVRPENGGADCVKDYTYSAGLRGESDDQFVELDASGPTGQGDVVFLEEVVFLPVDGSNQITQQLYYDDTLLSQNDPTLAPFCLLDPRVGAGTDSPDFDLHDDYDSAAEAGDVMPSGHTTCIINADFLTVGSDSGASVVTPVYYLYNVGDGFRTFK